MSLGTFLVINRDMLRRWETIMLDQLKGPFLVQHKVVLSMNGRRGQAQASCESG